ncbi:MAG: hypothetical protein ACHQ1G_07155 [Planctomycetota bacterium]
MAHLRGSGVYTGSAVAYWRSVLSIRVALIAVVTVLVGAGAAYVMATRGPAADHPAPEIKRVSPVDSRDLKATLVVASDRATVPAGKNVLWCASFQLAWDALRDFEGSAPIALGPSAPVDEVAALNEDRFPKGDLDPAAFVAMAGFGIAERFRDAARAKFGDVDLEWPEVLSRGPAALAMLFKDLPFEHPFEEYGGLRFAGGKAVRAFGMTESSDRPNQQAILGQVRIHMAEPAARPERFVLELAVRGRRDRLILARVDPAPTLRETWERARDAASGPGEPPESHLVLAIPKLDFDVEHRFAELQGASGALAAAFQRTKFRLDETGARLESHVYAARHSIDPRFLFDRPFLVALVQKGATRPYFLLWIANDELLMAQ